jgi:hypothetical protein
MKSHELLRQVFKKHGCKRLAQELGLSLSLIHQWSRPCGGDESGTSNPLDRVVTMLRLTGDLGPLQWLCGQANGYFVPNPVVKRSLSAKLLPATGGVLRELGDMQSALAAVLKHSKLTQAEAALLRQAWEKLKPVMERYVSDCERRTLGTVAKPRGGASARVWRQGMSLFAFLFSLSWWPESLAETAMLACAV